MTDPETTDNEGGLAWPNASPLVKRPMVSLMYAYAKVADTRADLNIRAAGQATAELEADLKIRAAGQVTAELEAGENAREEIIQRLYNLNKDCRDLLDKREKDYADLLLGYDHLLQARCDSDEARAKANENRHAIVSMQRDSAEAALAARKAQVAELTKEKETAAAMISGLRQELATADELERKAVQQAARTADMLKLERAGHELEYRRLERNAVEQAARSADTLMKTQVDVAELAVAESAAVERAAAELAAAESAAAELAAAELAACESESEEGDTAHLDAHDYDSSNDFWWVPELVLSWAPAAASDAFEAEQAEAEKRAAAERADAEAAEAVADQVDAEAAEAVVGPQRVVRQPKQSLENLYAYLAHHR
jgi:hypothetical protein